MDPEDLQHAFVTGSAWYVDDLVLPADALHVALGLSDCATGTLLRLDLDAVRSAAGVVSVLTASDIPGINLCSPLGHDPVFVASRIEYHGQVLFAVVARTVESALAAVHKAHVHVESSEAVITLDDARARGDLLCEPLHLCSGDPAAAWSAAPHEVDGTLVIGGQEHFYMEGQVAIAWPEADGEMRIVASTQNPAEVQHMVAGVLGLTARDVTVQCPRLGGGFGGKETQATQFACIAALASRMTGKVVKVRVPRRADMRITGKRHDMEARWRAGYGDDGRLHVLEVQLDVRGGYSLDLSRAVAIRALLHLDNTSFIPAVDCKARVWKTNTSSNTAFRGFGAPQAMLVIESVLDRIARKLALDPIEIRRRNYYGTGRGEVTPYGMPVSDNPLHVLTDALVESASWGQRRAGIDAFNRVQPVLRRGLGFTAVKFGLSFTQTHLNQAGVLLNIYNDGSVRLAHGGTEMGQGLDAKVGTILARALGISTSRLRITSADTSRVPNASATAASVSTDLIGQAAINAASILRDRLIAFARKRWEFADAECDIRDDELVSGNTRVPFATLIHEAWLDRVELSSTGFYRTPDIHFDAVQMQGRPFHYFVYGACLAEIVLDTLTGESRVVRVDIVQDAGASLDPLIDRGQIEGAFMQGQGWLTMEEVRWSRSGELLTDDAETYRIPTASDAAPEFNVTLLDLTPGRAGVFRSRGVGEPPLPLAIAVHLALRDAVASVCPEGAARLGAPATPEALLTVLPLNGDSLG